ncbi:Kinetochore protein Spc24 [Thecaphora frezii]
MDLFSDAESEVKVDIRTDPSESLNQLSFNKEFAERYLHNKQRDELQRLEEKYGKDAAEDDDDDESESSSEEETEDEDGEQLTAQIDAAVFRTLQKIRNKDASLYDPKVDVFAEEEKAAREAAAAKGVLAANQAGSAKGKKDKKVTLQDYQRQRVQELIATAADPAQAIAEATMAPKTDLMDEDGHGHGHGRLLAPAQEQEELRKEVSKAFHEGVEGDDDDLFTKRSADDSSGSGSYRDSVLAALGDGADEATLRAALGDLDEPPVYPTDSRVTRRDEGGDRDAKDKKKSKKKAMTEQEKFEQSKEDFLLDYILNQGWIDKSDANVPVKPKVDKALLRQRQAEAAGAANGNEAGDGAADKATGSNAYGRDWEAEAAELESEASFDSKAEAFETAYNFRFEQGDEAFVIPSYARNPKDSVRREDTTRKRKREERMSRKEEEKRQRMQELARLKNLKRVEIVEKLKKLKEATGSNVEGFDNIDLEHDFDPEEHDRAMQGAFNDQYYQEADDEFDPEMEKPTWDDDINIDDILAEEAAHAKKSGKKQKQKAGCGGGGDDDDDDERIEMDADFLDDADGGGAAGGGIEGIRAQLTDKKLSKKDRKKLKKKLKAAEEKAAKRAVSGATHGDDDDDNDGGVDIDEMDADAAPRRDDSKGDDGDVPLTEAERKAKAKEMMDEYYKLDYEDMIGDLPTRFKYTQVPKSDFGLSPVEILLADDAQLNKVVGLKALQPYRKGKTRPIDLGKRLHSFRNELRGGGGKDARKKGGADKGAEGGGEGEAEPAKRMGKKERMRKKKAAEAAAAGGEPKGKEGERASKKAKTE